MSDWRLGRLGSVEFVEHRGKTDIFERRQRVILVKEGREESRKRQDRKERERKHGLWRFLQKYRLLSTLRDWPSAAISLALIAPLQDPPLRDYLLRRLVAPSVETLLLKWAMFSPLLEQSPIRSGAGPGKASVFTTSSFRHPLMLWV